MLEIIFGLKKIFFYNSRLKPQEEYIVDDEVRLSPKLEELYEFHNSILLGISVLEIKDPDRQKRKAFILEKKYNKDFLVLLFHSNIQVKKKFCQIIISLFMSNLQIDKTSITKTVFVVTALGRKVPMFICRFTIEVS